MRPIGEQLQRARELAGYTKSELARRLGWVDHSNVTRIEGGRGTETGSLVRWAEECGHEVLIVPAGAVVVQPGSVEAVAARLHESKDEERAIALALLDLLRAARFDDPEMLPMFQAEIARERLRLERLRERLRGTG